MSRGEVVYAIRCVPTNKLYIGHSRHVEESMRMKIYTARRGELSPPELQNDFDKYGEDSFEFYAIPTCRRQIGGIVWSMHREASEIIKAYDTTNPLYGYNVKKREPKGEPVKIEFKDGYPPSPKGDEYKEEEK